MLPIDPELLRRQLDEQLRRNVELAYQDYLTKVRALETVVRAQGEIAAGLPPLTLHGLLAAPPALLSLPPALEPLLALTATAGLPLPAPAPPAPPVPAGEAAAPSAPQDGPAVAPQAGPAPTQEPVPTAPPAPAPAVKRPRKRAKAQDYEVYNAIFDALDQLGEAFDKRDISRVLGYQPKKSNLADALFELVKEKVLEVDWYGLGNKPTRYRRARPPAPEPVGGE